MRASAALRADGASFPFSTRRERLALKCSHGLGERSVGNVDQDDLKTGNRGDLGNAVAHGARADHSYGFDFHGYSFVSALNQRLLDPLVAA